MTFSFRACAYAGKAPLPTLSNNHRRRLNTRVGPKSDGKSVKPQNAITKGAGRTDDEAFSPGMNAAIQLQSAPGTYDFAHRLWCCDACGGPVRHTSNLLAFIHASLGNLASLCEGLFPAHPTVEHDLRIIQ